MNSYKPPISVADLTWTQAAALPRWNNPLHCKEQNQTKKQTTKKTHLLPKCHRIGNAHLLIKTHDSKSLLLQCNFSSVERNSISHYSVIIHCQLHTVS